MNEKLDERSTTAQDGIGVNIEPEKKIVADMLWRGIKVAPAWLVLSFLIWGTDGAAPPTHQNQSETNCLWNAISTHIP